MSMNPFCEIALEEAVRIRERKLADDVVMCNASIQTVEDRRIALVT